jgi:uncharacterized coiled-coil protein SlyX
MGTDVSMQSGPSSISDPHIAANVSIVSVPLLGSVLISIHNSSPKALSVNKQVATVTHSEFGELRAEIHSLKVGLENRMSVLENTMSGLENTMSGFQNRIGGLERMVGRINNTLHMLYEQAQGVHAPLVHEREM